MEYPMTVITQADAPEDMIYTLAKTLHGHKADLAAAHPSFNAMNPANLAVQQPGVQYHPGAVRFYEEAGIWPAN